MRVLRILNNDCTCGRSRFRDVWGLRLLSAIIQGFGAWLLPGVLFHKFHKRPGPNQKMKSLLS